MLTVQDLVDMLDLQQATAMQQYAQQQAAGPRRPQRNWQAGDLGYDRGSLEDDIAGAVVGAAFKFAARAAGRRLKRAVEEQVMPAAMAKAEEAQRERHAVAERYPELSGCTRDQVIFLAGGSRTVPLSELSGGQITMAMADSIVARLR